MLKKILFISSLVVLIFSCKKKDKESPTTQTQGTSIDTSSYYGILTSSEASLYYNGNNLPLYAKNEAYFKSTPFSDDFMEENFINAGAVSLNNVIFYITNPSSSYIYYRDTSNTSLNYGPSYNWKVSGGNGVPAIDYTFTEITPTYTGISSIAGDTIKLNQLNTLSLNGISGADEIVVQLSDVASGNGYLVKTINGNSTSITLNQNELSNITLTGSSSSALISVMCYKNRYQTFGGKKYKLKVGYIAAAEVTIM